MTTNIDLANRALATIGTRSQLVAFNDGSSEGLYCGLLYDEFRDYLLRVGDYDFAGDILPLTGEAPVNIPWAWRYDLPANFIRIRQLIPYVAFAFDPQPLSWNVTADTIFSTVRAVEVYFTTNIATEDHWDSVFTEAFVRFLASGLAFALENRIEAHKTMIEQALQFAAQGMVINP